MDKIGLIYSFHANKSSKAAKKIADALGESLVEHLNAEELSEKEFMKFSKYILGVPTWFDGELPNYWDEFVPALEDLNLKNKVFAIFGNGDQKGYPENFVDGIGIMADLLESRGAKIVGFTPMKGFTFERSRAQRDDMFAGLVLDYENQSPQINKRIKDWAVQLKKEFNIK